MRDNFVRRVQDQKVHINQEMGTLKDALNDYMNENFNQSKQASFLKNSQSAIGFSLPLKDK